MKTALLSIANQAVVVLLPFAFAAAIALARYGWAWLKTHTKNTKVQGLLDHVGHLAWLAVQEVEQTVVAQLPANPTADDYKKAKDAAIDSLKSHLGPKGLDELKKEFGWDDGSLLKNLGSYVEANVFKLNTLQTTQQAAPTAVAVAAPAAAGGAK